MARARRQLGRATNRWRVSKKLREVDAAVRHEQPLDLISVIERVDRRDCEAP